MGTIYDGTVDGTGWSPTPLEFDKNKQTDYSKNSSYEIMHARWFTSTYWNRWLWARKFTNNTPMKLKISQMTFKACTGHSGGKDFKSSNGVTQNVAGRGCTFYVTIYREGVNVPIAISEGHVLSPITSFNCDTSSGGAGATYADKTGTNFGQDIYYGEGKPLHLDTKNRPRNAVPCVFKNFKDLDTSEAVDLIIEPGQSIFVVLNTRNWKYDEGVVDDGKKGLIVIESSSSNWNAVVEPEESDYIWIFNGTKWVKERSAYALTSAGWTKLN